MWWYWCLLISDMSYCWPLFAYHGIFNFLLLTWTQLKLWWYDFVRFWMKVIVEWFKRHKLQVLWVGKKYLIFFLRKRWGLNSQILLNRSSLKVITIYKKYLVFLICHLRILLLCGILMLHRLINRMVIC